MRVCLIVCVPGCMCVRAHVQRLVSEVEAGRTAAAQQEAAVAAMRGQVNDAELFCKQLVMESQQERNAADMLRAQLGEQGQVCPPPPTHTQSPPVGYESVCSNTFPPLQVVLAQQAELEGVKSAVADCVTAFPSVAHSDGESLTPAPLTTACVTPVRPYVAVS